MKIRSWSVEGYKSIKDDHSIEFDQYNILVGKNNSGKSSIIDSLKDYSEAFPNGETLEAEWIIRRCTGKQQGSPVTIKLHFEFSEDEHQRLLEGIRDADLLDDRNVSDFLNRGDFKEVHHTLRLFPTGYEGKLHSVFTARFDGNWYPLRTYDHHDDPLYLNFNALPNLRLASGRRRAFVIFTDIMEDAMSSWKSTSAFRRPEDQEEISRTVELRAGGDNLARVLLTLSGLGDGRYSRISDEYSKIMPGVAGIRTPIVGQNDTTVVVDEPALETGFDLKDISSGSKEILTLITQIILASENTDLLMIEEPELHLHPGAEQKIYNLIQDIFEEDGPQVMISTHSNVFLDQSDIKNIIRIRRGKYTTLKRVDSEEAVRDLREMGFQFSGMLQSDAVVFVEGRSDKVIISEIAERYGFNMGEWNVALVDLDNWEEMRAHSRSLVKFASEFEIPYLFIADTNGTDPAARAGNLIEQINRSNDGDDGSPTEVWWNKAKEDNVKVWNEPDIEGYLLSDIGAVSAQAGCEPEDVERILSNNEDKDPDQVLEEIFRFAKPNIDSDLDAYKKVNDGGGIAGRIDIAQLPEEYHEVMRQIAELVDAVDSIDEAIEEALGPSGSE